MNEFRDNTFRDEVGIGWRPELAGGIFDHLDRIDLIELIADDYFNVPRRKLRALRTLSEQVPVVLHGIGMGLASATPVEQKRVGSMARLVDQVRPQFWSEHLAFVRADGFEIGHLAASPRTMATVESTAENLHRVSTIVGSMPLMENIATLIDPPASTLSEASWVARILDCASCDLLLDLHNILANGLNHGYDPKQFLAQIPSTRIRVIHIAGGELVSAPDGSRRLLDDHLHDVPDAVFDLLEHTAALAPQSLTVILERDGLYPSMNDLLVQLDRARLALERGRARHLHQQKAVA